MAKRFIYVSVYEREFAEPQIYNNIEDARKAMRNDFLETIGDDTVDDVLENEKVDLRDYNTYYTNPDGDFGISENEAYINECGISHGSWDAKIYLSSF